MIDERMCELVAEWMIKPKKKAEKRIENKTKQKTVKYLQKIKNKSELF